MSEQILATVASFPIDGTTDVGNIDVVLVDIDGQQVFRLLAGGAPLLDQWGHEVAPFATATEAVTEALALTGWAA